ncbi:unnamed protein product [Ilex paraguariensis]|uniref:Uncharacterized protein n=1 Tax=Ilex paraguariensis TaxID=185542 RepID=A0ABC8TBL0_9AQUA
MASCLSPPIYTPSSPTIQCTPFLLCRYSPNHFFSFTAHLHRSSLLFPTRPNSWYRRCRAASPGPPSPPESDPPTGDEPTSSSGQFDDSRPP